MFDLIVSGGTAVMPASTEAADIGFRRQDRRDRGAREPGRDRRGAGGRRRGADRHSRRHHPHIHAGMPIVGGRATRMCSAPDPIR